MSAFVVTKQHIAAIVRWYADSIRGTYNYNDAVNDANHLMAANVHSVNCRYQQDDEPETFCVADICRAPKVRAVQVLKAIACLDYQSCEFDAWDRSAERFFLKVVERCAIAELPGYKESPWEIR